jgi:hypothetical protein
MTEVRRNGKGGKTTAVVNKIKPRTTFSPGHEPVKFQNNYRQVQGRSQYYFEEVPVRDLLPTFPTRTGKAVDPTGFEPAP